MPHKNVLVVGGAGYIGGAVTDELMAHGNYNFRVYDNLLYEDAYRKNVDFVFGDILKADQLAPQLDWADAVIWLAAVVGDGACTLDPNLTTRTNQNAVEWLADHFQGRIIFTSTCSVYGAQNELLTEESPTKPLSLYAGTKLLAERSLADKNALIVRLGTLYGVSDLFSRVRFDLVVNYMTAHALTHQEITVFGGDQWRPLVHVKDVARVLVEAINQAATGIFNIVERNMRMLDLARHIKNHWPSLTIHISDMPFEDTRNYQVSVARAAKILGWTPVWSVDDAITELRHLMETQKIKHWADDRYSNERYLRQALEKSSNYERSPVD